LPNWQNRANDYGGFLCTTAFGRSTTTTKSGGCDRQWEDSTDVWGIFHMMKIPLFTNNHEKSSTTYNRS
jgi:hypothetical protein